MEKLAKVLTGLGMLIGVVPLIYSAIIKQIDEAIINIVLFGAVICGIGVLIGWYVAIRAHIEN